MNLHLNIIHIYIYIYSLQPKYIQCSNVKNYGVKVSLFLRDVRVLDRRRKSS